EITQHLELVVGHMQHPLAMCCQERVPGVLGLLGLHDWNEGVARGADVQQDIARFGAFFRRLYTERPVGGAIEYFFDIQVLCSSRLAHREWNERGDKDGEFTSHSATSLVVFVERNAWRSNTGTTTSLTARRSGKPVATSVRMALSTSGSKV